MIIEEIIALLFAYQAVSKQGMDRENNSPIVSIDMRRINADLTFKKSTKSQFALCQKSFELAIALQQVPIDWRQGLLQGVVVYR